VLDTSRRVLYSTQIPAKPGETPTARYSIYFCAISSLPLSRHPSRPMPLSRDLRIKQGYEASRLGDHPAPRFYQTRTLSFCFQPASISPPTPHYRLAGFSWGKPPYQHLIFSRSREKPLCSSVLAVGIDGLLPVVSTSHSEHQTRARFPSATAFPNWPAGMLFYLEQLLSPPSNLRN
jgi:hypothetical protein